jgi:hypothetical protein
MTNKDKQTQERMNEEDIPVRCAVLDLEGKLIGYKIDTFWSLSRDPEKASIRSLKYAGLGEEGNLAQSLLGMYDLIHNVMPDSGRKGYIRVNSGGVVVSVQDISESNFGGEVFRYRVLKEGDEYLAQEA